RTSALQCPPVKRIMADDPVRGHHTRCVRALVAARNEASAVSGSTGVLLRRTMTDFDGLVRRLNEEADKQTEEQLQQILKSIDSFHQAINSMHASLAARTHREERGGEAEELDHPPVLSPVKVTEGDEDEEEGVKGEGEGEEQRGGPNQETMEEEGEKRSRDDSAMLEQPIEEHREEEGQRSRDDSAMLEESMRDDSGIADEWSPEKEREEETSGMVEDSLRIFSASEEPSTSKKAPASDSLTGTDYRYHRTCFVCGDSTASYVYSPKDPLRAGPFFDELELTADQRAVAQNFYVEKGARVIVCRSHVYEDDEEWMSKEESATDRYTSKLREHEEKLRSMGITESGRDVAKMPMAEFEALLASQQLSAEACVAAKDVRVKLKERYYHKRAYYAKKKIPGEVTAGSPVTDALTQNTSALKPSTVQQGMAKTKRGRGAARSDYTQLLTSLGVQCTFREIGKMPLNDFNAMLQEKGVTGEQNALMRMMRGRAKSALYNERLRDQKAKTGAPRAKASSAESMVADPSIDDDTSSTHTAIDTVLRSIDTISSAPILSQQPVPLFSFPIAHTKTVELISVKPPGVRMKAQMEMKEVKKVNKEETTNDAKTPPPFVCPISEADRLSDAEIRKALGLPPVVHLKEAKEEEPDVIELD
ncbi:hypothetical protein PENTCL1PPCAC_460, partial [Pristionchus entomophagus]